MAAKEFMQRLGIDIERQIFPGMALDGFQYLCGNILCFIPVLVVPLLQNRNGLAGALYVEFDIFCQAWVGEIGGPDKSRRADNLQSSMSDVGFGVKLVFSVNATSDLPRTDRVDDGRHSGEKVVF